jgi:hypothetical protein
MSATHPGFSHGAAEQIARATELPELIFDGYRKPRRSYSARSLRIFAEG